MEINESILRKLILNILNDYKDTNKSYKLLIFTGDDEYKLNKFLVEAREIVKNGYFKVAIDKDAQNIIKDTDITNALGVQHIYKCGQSIDVDDILKDVDTIILGSMNLNLASKVSNLIADSLSSRLISEGIMMGVRILSSPIMEYKEIKNENYSRAIEKLQNNLMKFDIRFMKLEDIKTMFNNCKEQNTIEKLNGKIITEKIVKDYKGSELKVPSNAIITPIAKDLIKEKNIVLVKGENQ